MTTRKVTNRLSDETRAAMSRLDEAFMEVRRMQDAVRSAQAEVERAEQEVVRNLAREGQLGYLKVNMTRLRKL